MQSIVQFIGVMGVTVSLVSGIAFAVKGYEYFSNQNTNVFLKTIYMMSWTYMSFVLGFVTTVSLPLVMMFVVFNMDKLNIIIKGMPSNTTMDHEHNFDGVHDTEEDETDDHEGEETQEATSSDAEETQEATETEAEKTQEATPSDAEETQEATETETGNSSSNETNDHSDRVSDETTQQNVASEADDKSSSEVTLTQTVSDKTDKTVEIKQELQNILETMRKSGPSNDTE